MRIIQTFWSAGKNLLDDPFGWYSAQHHLMGWALSCLLLEKHFGGVELYTDEAGYEILIKQLRLPYRHVHLIFNQDEFPADLWALAKIKTYACQETPFIHVDGDVFIFESFDSSLLSAGLIAQNNEKATRYYHYNYTRIMRCLDYIPDALRFDIDQFPVCACNTGIIGGNDLDFFKHYTGRVFEFVNKNQTEKIPPEILPNYNIIFEQMLFARLSILAGKEVNCFFKDTFDDFGYHYESIADFTAVPHAAQYLHLLGPFKGQFIACDLMSRTLLRDYPAHFSLVTNLFNGVAQDNEPADTNNLPPKERLRFNRKLAAAKRHFNTLSVSELSARNNRSMGFLTFLNYPVGIQSRQVLVIDQYIRIIATNQNWGAGGSGESENVQPIIAIAYIPEFFLIPYSKVLLDAMDYNILQSLSQPVTFTGVLQKLEACFDPIDIELNYEGFRSLILSRIKELIIRKCVCTLNTDLLELN
ncbi:DUF6734 family protein [Mucilaginibacter sp.]|uniref:DUF6734 family protein n=1 Tax=Mucilaginibacter sp. TaxID=1882438 RepID=UPI0025DCA9C5|nr:DUF6734 family protein [Mucilaginibacter sp.]